MNSTCDVCGSSGSLIEHEARRICSVCGNVTTSNQELEAQYGFGVNMLSSHSNVTSSRRKISKRERLRAVQYTLKKDVVMKTYLQILQACLIDQIKIVIKFGINPAIKHIAYEIWFQVIKVSRILSQDAIANAIKEIREEKKIFYPEESIDSFSYEEATNLFDARNPDIWKYLLWYMFDPEIIIYILYTSMIWLRESVNAVDIALWINEGLIPYYNMNKYCVDILDADKHIDFPEEVFVVKKIPAPFDIENGSIQLCIDIGLKLPIPNIPLQIHRVIRILDFPMEIAFKAVELHRLLTWDRLVYGKGLRPVSLSIPHHILFALIVIALKLCYGLDGRKSEISHFKLPHPIQNKCWISWAQNIMETKLRIYDTFSLSSEILKNANENDLSRIFNRCSKRYCRHFHDNEDEEKIIKEMERIIMTTKRQKKKKLDIEEREENNNIMFSFGNEYCFVPDTFKMPCPLYWNSYINDFAWPVEYSAVIAVFSQMSGIVPEYLHNYISKLEALMYKQERLCYYMQGIDRRKYRKKSILNARTFTKVKKRQLNKLIKQNHKNIKYAKRQEGYYVKINILVTMDNYVYVEIDCLNVLDNMPEDWFGTLDNNLDLDFYFSHCALHNYETMRPLKRLRLSKICKPRPMEEKERKDEYKFPEQNPIELLKCCKMAKEMGQPFVILFYTNLRSIFPLDAKRKFIKNADCYESDVEPISDHI